MSAKQKRLEELRRTIAEVTPEEAQELRAQGAVLVDVREDDETSQGSPAGAERIVRGFLELRIEEKVPDLDSLLLLLCGGGSRSLFAARDLLDMGYRDVRSVAGGFDAWKSASLPVEVPKTLDDDTRLRYDRHLRIPEVGEAGQLRLLESKVMLVGAGGLGSPAALYLAAAGVGTLAVVDDDRVDRTNLQRQILHTDDRVGEFKTTSAKVSLSALNPDIEVVGLRERLAEDNVDRLVKGFDVVIDGSDNFSTRYLLNDACFRAGIPHVYGSIFRFEGQVSVFWPGRAQDPGPCYRCLFAEPPPPELAPSCSEAGVLGALPGVVGTLQAVEALKLLLGIGETLIGRLLLYDALGQRFTELRIAADRRCSLCGDGPVEERASAGGFDARPA